MITPPGRKIVVNADGTVTIVDELKAAEPVRGTFTGTAEDFAAAKRAAVAGLPPAEPTAVEPEPKQPASDDRLAEIVAENKPFYIHTKPGWDTTRH